MREIEFRGKRIDDGKWVHGSYTSMREKDRNNPFCQVESKTFHRIWQWEAGDWNMGGYANYEVIPETVGQFTGLKDKNGVKIYEGDLMKIKETEFNIEGVHEVYYHIDGYVTSSVLFSNKDNANKDCLQYQISHKEAYVIGNKYDNPELLNMERNK